MPSLYLIFSYTKHFVQVNFRLATQAMRIIELTHIA